ncbi:MAG TPA: tetratricopeptide repeat protein [Terriglobia bacterium]|nr:tetratricopeptide repeat protein [Terriglobia bacterium]
MRVISPRPAFRLAALIFVGFLLSDLFAFGQSPANQNSVTVIERLSADEVEEGKLNDVYQSVAQLQRQGGCTIDMIQRYQSEVIPAAEKSTLNTPKNKFLFLANRDLGNCYLEHNKFSEAEASFQKALEYLPVWPGTSDSAYPINLRQIATAQMGQQHWTEAEQSLLKSISLFDAQISAWEKKDAEFSLTYRGSQSRSYALLAVVYFREGRLREALSTLEKAYADVTNYKLDPIYRNELLSIGKAIANASGDSAAQELWSQRNPNE